LEDELATGAAMAKAASMKRNARNFIFGVRRCRLCMLCIVHEILWMKWRIERKWRVPWI
jgi:hypothetical protein